MVFSSGVCESGGVEGVGGLWRTPQSKVRSKDAKVYSWQENRNGKLG